MKKTKGLNRDQQGQKSYRLLVECYKNDENKTRIPIFNIENIVIPTYLLWRLRNCMCKSMRDVCKK